MNVKLKLFATLSDYLPPAEERKGNEVALEVPAETTVAQIIERFNLPQKLVHLVLINGHFVPPAARTRHALTEGDVLAIWPPIAGG
jgi:thiamine biosynthesis protein ThiS